MTVSPRALEVAEDPQDPQHSWYFDISLIADYLVHSHRYHHTASATMFYALREGLALIEEEGLENRWERHHKAHLEFVKESKLWAWRCTCPTRPIASGT